MSGTAATGLGTWLADWRPLAMAGGVGAACRWCVDTSVSRLSGRAAREAATGGRQRRRSGVRAPWMSRMLRMPWGTVVVNVTACLLMGLLVGRAADPPHSGTWAATALTVVGTGAGARDPHDGGDAGRRRTRTGCRRSPALERRPAGTPPHFDQNFTNDAAPGRI